MCHAVAVAAVDGRDVGVAIVGGALQAVLALG